MKSRLFLLIAVTLIFATATNVAQAGCWHGGGYWHGGGGYYCAPRVGWGWGGGWCAPRVGCGGWWGPSIGISVAVPPPAPVYYRTAYYARPVYRSSALAQAQAQLASLGYYRGAVDGQFGPLTSRAIVLYQSDNHLAVTGRLDRTTLRSLGI